MRIGFVFYDFYPLRERQEQCMNMATELSQRGHAIHLFTRTWKGRFPKGLQVHLLGRLGRSAGSQNLHFLESLEEALAMQPVDGIVAFDPIPRCDIYFPKDTEIEELSRPERKNEKALIKQKPAPAIFCLNSKCADRIEATKKKTAKRIQLLPPDVRKVTRTLIEKAQTRDELRSEFNVPEGRQIALYKTQDVSASDGLENCLNALQATLSKCELELWVLGSGDPGKYVAETTQNALKVRFLGGRSDTERFLDAADVLLHPQPEAATETYLLEALVYGLPVIATMSIRYAAEVEAYNAAILLESASLQESLNHELAELLQSSSARKKLIKNGLEYAKAYLSCDAAETTASLILETLNQQNGSN